MHSIGATDTFPFFFFLSLFPDSFSSSSSNLFLLLFAIRMEEGTKEWPQEGTVCVVVEKERKKKALLLFIKVVPAGKSRYYRSSSSSPTKLFFFPSSSSSSRPGGYTHARPPSLLAVSPSICVLYEGAPVAYKLIYERDREKKRKKNTSTAHKVFGRLRCHHFLLNVFYFWNKNKRKMGFLFYSLMAASTLMLKGQSKIRVDFHF